MPLIGSSKMKCHCHTPVAQLVNYLESEDSESNAFKLSIAMKSGIMKRIS